MCSSRASASLDDLSATTLPHLCLHYKQLKHGAPFVILQNGTFGCVVQLNLCNKFTCLSVSVQNKSSRR
jgi:hypothetical protein